PAYVETYCLSLHDALPIDGHDQDVRLDAHRHRGVTTRGRLGNQADGVRVDLDVVFDEVEPELHGEAARQHVGADLARLHQRVFRSEEHTSELQSRGNLVCR